MFETSQQEQGSGSGKIVGGVIAVVAVLLLVVYFLFLHGQPQSTPASMSGGTGTAASGQKADPTKDLSIVKSTLHKDTQTQTMAMWDIQVANKNKGFAYKDIHYATIYYSAANDILHQGGGTLSEQVDAGDQHSYSVNDGLYPLGTTHYSMEIKEATPVQQ